MKGRWCQWLKDDDDEDDLRWGDESENQAMIKICEHLSDASDYAGQ